MVNSYPLHVEAWENFLEQYGYKFKDISEELLACFIGMRVIDILKKIIKILNLNIGVEVMYQKRSEIFLKLVEEKL